MSLDFKCVFALNNILSWLNSYYPASYVDINSLYLLSIAIIGIIPLIVFMSGSRIGGKILDIGSKVGSLVGGAAGVVGVIQNSGNKGGSSGGNSGNTGGSGGNSGNTGGDNGNKGGNSGDKK